MYLRDSGTRSESHCLDWPRIAEIYDAVHFTQKGYEDNCWVPFANVCLMDVDVESTLWFRWCFDSVQKSRIDWRIKYAQ